jgi:hypothetical protein
MAELKEKHRLLRPEEVQQALAHYVLRLQGLDPDQLQVQHSIAFRVVDGTVWAGVYIESIALHEAAPKG